MSSFAFNREAELPPFFRGSEGFAWAAGMGAVQDAEMRKLRMAALSRLPEWCPDDALDGVGAWLLMPRYLGEANGTAVPRVGYRGRLCNAWSTHEIDGSAGAIIEAIETAFGIPGSVEITGDVHWENSWYTRFRVTINDIGAFTDEQRRLVIAIVLRLKWAYSYPVDVVITEDVESFYIGPLIDAGFIIDESPIGGYQTI